MFPYFVDNFSIQGNIDSFQKQPIAGATVDEKNISFSRVDWGKIY